MNKSVWDDDKCLAVWENLVTDAPYVWAWNVTTLRKFGEITGLDRDQVNYYSGSDLPSAMKLRGLVRDVLVGNDVDAAKKIGTWIVTDWGGIRGGQESVPLWIESLRPFNGYKVIDFIRTKQTDRISSWSKILSFFDYEHHAVYDSRTAIALNSAMVAAGLRPRFHMPTSQNSTLKNIVPVMKSKYKVFSSGYDEYIYLLQRFVGLGLTSGLLDAERSIFAGAEETAKRMISKYDQS